jgi:hypothetical protein
MALLGYFDLCLLAILIDGGLCLLARFGFFRVGGSKRGGVDGMID